MQANPDARVPFPANSYYDDPMFEECYQVTCYKTWGLSFVNSAYVFIYGAGLYSFFNNYDSSCLLVNGCQEHMVRSLKSQAIYVYALNTIGATDMVEVDDVALVAALPNGNWFAYTVSIFQYP